jgi:hypothetical protein
VKKKLHGPIPPELRHHFERRLLEGPEKLATILANLSRELDRLDRYERRALSRRKFAIRAFDALGIEYVRQRDRTQR